MTADIFRRARDVLPDDGVRIALVAVAMPLLFQAYQLAWTQTGARIVFSLSVGLLGWLVGSLIEERRELLGYFIGSCSIGATIAAIGSLVVLNDATWTWRTVMAGAQANVVFGWFVLWRVRQKWLSRTLAFWAFVAALVGFILYLLSNFGLPDPIWADPRTWGLTPPRGILARTLGYPLEPALAIVLWVAVILTLRRYLLRHGPG